MIPPEARARLAEQMEERRLELRLTWREAAEAGGISYEVIRNLRNGRGTGIAALTKRGIEAGLQWPPGTVDRILAGEPAPLPHARPPDHGSIFGLLPRELADRIREDYYDAIIEAAKPAADASGGRLPAGSKVFPLGRDAAKAAQWDDLAAQVRRLRMFPDDETLVYRVAETMATALWHARRQSDQSGSPVAASLGARRVRRPVRYRTV